MELNDCQRLAATCALDAHVRVIASPGSGKSRTLVARVDFLVAKRVPADRIKVVTFSRQAAQDIARRLPKEVEVRTIHAFALRFQALIDSQARERVGSLFGADAVPDDAYAAGAASGVAGPFYGVDEHVYRFKRRLETPEGLRAMRELGRIDFLLVDEAQDLDALQFGIVEILARSTKTRVFMAGDPNQNIYGFRRSEARFLTAEMLRLGHFRCLSFSLDVNYRSTRPIVALCNALRPDAASQGSVHMVSARGSGPIPALACFLYKANELDFVAKRVLELISAGESAFNVAVLSRTQRDCFAFCHKLVERGINARVVTADTPEARESAPGAPAITVCTFHAAKGLEWDHVFVIGACEIFNCRLMTPEEEAQEANLFYVAATRAKNSLLFTSPKRIYTRFLSRKDVRDHVVPLDASADWRIKTPLPIALPAGEPYNRCTRSVTHFVRHASGEIYATLKERGVVPEVYHGAALRNVHCPHIYPDPNSDSAALYALFLERVMQRQLDSICREMLVRRGADPAGVHNMLALDSGASSCFLYVDDRRPDDGARMSERDVAALVRMRADEFGVPADLVRVVSSDDGLPAYVVARGSLYRGGEVTGDIAGSFASYFDSRVNALRDSYKQFIRGVDPSGGGAGARVVADVAMCSFLVRSPPKTHLLLSKTSLDGGALHAFNRGLFAQTARVARALVDEEVALGNVPDADEPLVNGPAAPTVAGNDYYMDELSVGFDMDLSSEGLRGTCDLLVGTTIVEVKCVVSGSEAVTMQWIMQLLCYASLARRRGHRVDRIAVYNPLRGTLWIAPVDGWDRDAELLEAVDEFLSSEVGTTAGAT